MTCELKYGDGATLRLRLSSTAVLADCARPRGTPLDDPSAAVAAAVSDPIDFPPLQSALVPGDRVVIALDHGVPQSNEVLAGIVQSLLASDCPLGSISVVRADRETCDLSELPSSLRQAVDVSVHNPCDRASLSYLAASREGKPIYFNAKICDADVVLPVSTLRLQQALGYLGVHDGLFPTFSDEATQKRFRAPLAQDWNAHQRRRREEVDEAAWLLGVQFTVKITPGPGNSILHVLAGDGRAVAERGRTLCEAAWRHNSPHRANLVVATIEGGPDQQTWENFARALFSASQAVNDGGAILLCTELQDAPGPALQRLTSGADEQATMREIRRDRSSDAISAFLLAKTKQRSQVFLLSKLDGNFVEDLGVGHVSNVEDIERLSRQYDSCILLGNAHYAILAANEE